MNPFDPVNVLVIGKETLTARPIDFIYDKDKNVQSCIKYETTCPGCGCLVEFGVDTYRDENDVYHVGCENCDDATVPVDTSASIQRPDEIVIKARGQRTRLKKQEINVLDTCPFIDPVECGIFDPVQITFEESEGLVPVQGQ